MSELVTKQKIYGLGTYEEQPFAPETASKSGAVLANPSTPTHL